MKLSPAQISALKKLISSKGYEEIDVQYEILDHVACRIEVLMAENPTLKLDDAFRKAHSEFGIFGFSDLADSYRESIRKKFWNRYWASLKSLLSSYRVIYLFLLAWTFYFISENFTLFGEQMTAPFWGVVGLMLSMVFLVIYYHRVSRGFRHYATFKHALSFTGGMHLIMQFALQGSKYLTTPEIALEFTFQGVFAWVAIICMLIGWISIFLLPGIIKEAADETQRLKAIYEE